MYKKVETNLNFVEREKEILEFWKENKIFEKSEEINDKKGETFTFYDGPPTANGKPHIGHVLTRSMKDLIPRYKTMKGYSVKRKAGWDTHGLPVELEVEKSLNIDGKKEIEKYGIEPFIKKCKESVWKYKSEWEKMSDRVGYWADMENPYVTYDDNYIESVWWAVKQIADKGLLYKGYKVVPYCPRCGTALASHEVAQGYKDVKEKSIFVKFHVKGEDNAYFLAWTTTPWTLPSNVALCMNPKEDYVRIKVGDEFYILAEALVPSLFEEYEIVERRKGCEYEGTEYVPLFDFARFKEKAYYIVCDTYVTLTDGSGIVHIAPAFGEDDSLVGKKYKLPFVQMVDERGCFVEEATPFKGLFAKDADKPIIKDLQSRGLLFKELMYEHSYPFCWRCDTPLLYYARSSWFIKMTEVKDELVKNNASVNWIPETIGTGRMGNFIENVIDWGVSRERYWGTPLPVWTCDHCDHVHVIGSKQELKDLCGIEGDIELHRPYIDNATFKCPVCGGTMKRVSEVMDCWFDSGSMPFAQLHYPFENKELFEQHFPADFISEAVDQTRGWFYTLLAISTLLFDKAPFKNCLVLGHVGDKDGIKMSKHKGNVVDPWSVIDKQGADAVRWYFYSASSPWLPSRFYDEAVSESQRKFMGTLWNTYAFFVLYANIDNFNPNDYAGQSIKYTLMDRWILSKLNTLVKDVDEGLEKYDVTDTAREIQDFVDELSNWYVRVGRERYWGSEMTEDKKAAYMTLYTVLVTLAKVIAPYTPFLAESLYQNLVRSVDESAPVSVHLCSFPTFEASAVDKALEEGMENVLNIVNLGRAARNASNIKNRQPLGVMYITSGKDLELSDELKAVIESELNVKTAVTSADADKFISYELKPNLPVIGKKYGKLVGAIRAYLQNCNAKEIVDCVKAGEVFKAEISGAEVEFALDDLLINTVNKEGFVAESDKGVTVVLDTTITEELKNEGVLREIVSKIQTMRKEADFMVTDRIAVGYSADGRAKKVIADFADELKQSVLCERLSETLSGYQKAWDINGESVTLSVEKI